MRRPDIIKDSSRLKKMIVEIKDQRGLTNKDLVRELQSLGVTGFTESALSRYFKRRGSGSLSQLHILTLAGFLGIKVKLSLDLFQDRNEKTEFLDKLITLLNETTRNGSDFST